MKTDETLQGMLDLLTKEKEAAINAIEGAIGDLEVIVEKKREELEYLHERMGVAQPKGPKPVVLVGGDGRFTEVISDILRQHPGATLTVLWDTFNKQGFTCPGKNPRDTFSARISNMLRGKRPLINKVGTDPNRYGLNASPGIDSGVPSK